VKDHGFSRAEAVEGNGFSRAERATMEQGYSPGSRS